MMRPMKLAGSELMFGEGSLAYIKTIKAKKVSIVIGGHSMEKSGMLAKVEGYFKETGAETMVIRGVEPDPSFETVLRGRNEMLEFEPDLIVGLGGGSAMDAAKAMWAFYEYPDVTFEDLCIPFNFPELRTKAKFAAIPSTSGTATEVTAFSVITDYNTGIKYPLADFNITPDVAIVDPPRKGLDGTTIDSLVKMNPERIVYVSCDPATLARDCAVLNERGYGVEVVQPVDMFPQTTHVETVVLMSKVR